MNSFFTKLEESLSLFALRLHTGAWNVATPQELADLIAGAAEEIVTEIQRQKQFAAEGYAEAPPFTKSCNCSCGDACPLGKVGSGPRCTADQLREGLMRVRASLVRTPLLDVEIDAILSPGRAKRWNNDGRQYDRDTARLIERAVAAQSAAVRLTRTEQLVMFQRLCDGPGGCSPFTMAEAVMDHYGIKAVKKEEDNGL